MASSLSDPTPPAVPGERPLAGGIATGAVACVAAMLLAGCGGSPTEAPSVASLSITPSSLHFSALGVDSQLVARAFEISGVQVDGVTVEWDTQDPSVADVLASGSWS